MKRGEPMKTYLVGGAVRDMLMGLEPKDRDYVVVGSSVDEMLAAGFEKVGADFPVFLKDNEEYALARREKKTGTGYLGFTSEFGSDVTLEEGTVIQSLNKELLQKFIDAGYNLSDDYTIEELIEFFRHTTL
jgi:tRNA nucleotidyltransferase (CCA-adding enzyme)